MKIIRFISGLCFVTILSACGGGGSDYSNNDVTNNEKPQETPDTNQGTPTNPAFLKINTRNSINENSFNNYYKYDGEKGEKILIRVNLHNPLSDLQKTRCAGSSGLNTEIHVYDSSNNRIDRACGESLVLSFPENGTYIFHFDYPSTNHGFFNAASLKINSPIIFKELGNGTPTDPKKVDLQSKNKLVSNVFENYYWISALKGEKIYLKASLDKPMSDQQKNRCAGSSSHDTQIIIYNNNLNKIGSTCGDSITYDVPEDGNYIFNFSYGSQSSGYFNMAK